MQEDFSAKGIMVTGAAGFIGSCMVALLNENGFENLLLVDKFSRNDKERNYSDKKFAYLVEREDLFEWLNNNDFPISLVIHLGARTDTTEFDYSVLEELNVEYSKNIWNYCTINKIPLIYASSAATYGNGDAGYLDSRELLDELHPLNPYGESKNEFDKWAFKQENSPIAWAGLKFFNVYGPNEYHKGRMASVIFHSYNQIYKEGITRLFRSYKDDFKDGEQSRDFIYVKDVVEIMFWMTGLMMQQQWPLERNGLFNIGTGKARTFIDLAKATFTALDLPAKIIFIDMPEDIRDTYQYFTEAKIDKLKTAGYTKPFYSLEDGVNDYVRNYLRAGKIW